MNSYAIGYKHDNDKAPAQLTIEITQAAKADTYENNMVNQNDVLESVHIYNAAALGINTGYTVSVVMGADPTVLNDAVYDATWDRLTFTNDKSVYAQDLQLPHVLSIQLTRK